MARALVHFRFRKNNASLLDADRHYRPGDVAVVTDNPATGAGGEESEEFLVVTLAGAAADWAHLTEEVRVCDQLNYKEPADPDDRDTRTVKKRRYQLDMTKCSADQVKVLDDRKPILATRVGKYAELSEATHLLHKARLGGRQKEEAKIPAIIAALDAADTALESLRMEPVEVDAGWVLDRGTD